MENYPFRFSYHKRPPKLYAPGILHFKSQNSHKYYFHKSGARIIKSSHFMKRYHLGRKISFICVAKGHPRPNIIWLKDGLELDAYAGYEHVIILFFFLLIFSFDIFFFFYLANK